MWHDMKRKTLFIVGIKSSLWYFYLMMRTKPHTWTRIIGIHQLHGRCTCGIYPLGHGLVTIMWRPRGFANKSCEILSLCSLT